MTGSEQVRKEDCGQTRAGRIATGPRLDRKKPARSRGFNWMTVEAVPGGSVSRANARDLE
jgi:hypothetical protein